MRSRRFQVAGFSLGRSIGSSVGAGLALLAGCAAAPVQPGVTAPHPDPLRVHPNGPTPQDPGSSAPTKSPEPTQEEIEESARQIYLVGVDSFDAREWDKAIRDFQKCLNVDPTYYRALFKIGLCYYNKQRYDLEIQYYERCLDINPVYPEALLNLGNAYLAADDLEKAVAMYQRVLRLDPVHPVVLYNLGLVYYDLQQFQLAVRYLEQYISAHPDGVDRAKADRYLKLARERLQGHGP